VKRAIVRFDTFVAAFNPHDVEVMLSLADDEIEWINIAGATSAIETAGKGPLRLRIAQRARAARLVLPDRQMSEPTFFPTVPRAGST
jgi:hypothetical protein